ncbi:uncharacterized protein LOC126677331 isoform X2 [Mercurialis annua]|uniref:uncharacterized protein LOC126677331 isoform X2 n=1 Tax=Mercurialis annua TaxID=3986 RepID=UPI0024AFAF77|nr:uncharacterized protein LOC126677331 isoform X2 [Mercurialis annua]
MAAGVLNISQSSLFRSIPGNNQTPPSRRRPIMLNPITVRATSETSTAATGNKEDSNNKVEAPIFSAPPNFKAPKPQRFAVKPEKIFDILGAALALPFRLGTGVFVSGYSASFVSKDEIPPDQYALEFAGFTVKETSNLGPRPEKPIEIYEFEGCPFCRKVREIVTVLDIDVLYYPCPQKGPTFRPKAIQMGGKRQFPYMVDPNTGTAMYESDAIIKYLVDKYGDGKVPLMLSLGLFTTLTAGFAMIGRAGKGSSYTPAKLPPKPLEIWSYEGSPFCKIVRETLVELELPHIQRSCARGSPKRNILYQKAKHFQVLSDSIQISRGTGSGYRMRW